VGDIQINGTTRKFYALFSAVQGVGAGKFFDMFDAFTLNMCFCADPVNISTFRLLLAQHIIGSTNVDEVMELCLKYCDKTEQHYQYEVRALFIYDLYTIKKNRPEV